MFCAIILEKSEEVMIFLVIIYFFGFSMKITMKLLRFHILFNL